MKYLASFKPSKELSNLILKQKNIVLPGSGLHTSICFFPLDSLDEHKLISDLSRVKFRPFEIETLEFDDFDKDSLVLKLSCPQELANLHERVLSIVAKYSDLSFEASIQNYCGERYSPHLTISESSSNFDRISKVLIGHKFEVSEYFLSKKTDATWKNIQTFYSKIRS